MHNFYESSSVDVRSLQSDTIEHLGDSAHRTISESAEQSGDIDDNTELPRDIDQGRANQGDTALIVGTPKVSIQSGDASLRNESEGNYSGISEMV
ncbi:hypothetical protein DPMN_073353 [Dreissena polymorpha]|uniref:Uncharacterized protein n=1 Tax=Dreissena polymorpha TaxID=45954 RepID=A0A9D4HAU7_DREPO|nr:hypothetical protein DPMN_073353 [Dreissena polymorpha]